jgi:hypothetical protein
MAAQAAETGRNMTSLKTRDGTRAEGALPVPHAGDHGVAVGGYDGVVQRIYAASLDLHSALAILDSDRVAERIDQAINDLDEAITQIRLTTAWPYWQPRDHRDPSGGRRPRSRDSAERPG